MITCVAHKYKREDRRSKYGVAEHRSYDARSIFFKSLSFVSLLEFMHLNLRREQPRLTQA